MNSLVTYERLLLLPTGGVDVHTSASMSFQCAYDLALTGHDPLFVCSKGFKDDLPSCVTVDASMTHLRPDAPKCNGGRFSGEVLKRVGMHYVESFAELRALLASLHVFHKPPTALVLHGFSELTLGRGEARISSENDAVTRLLTACEVVCEAARVLGSLQQERVNAALAEWQSRQRLRGDGRGRKRGRCDDDVNEDEGQNENRQPNSRASTSGPLTPPQGGPALPCRSLVLVVSCSTHDCSDNCVSYLRTKLCPSHEAALLPAPRRANSPAGSMAGAGVVELVVRECRGYGGRGAQLPELCRAHITGGQGQGQGQGGACKPVRAPLRLCPVNRM